MARLYIENDMARFTRKDITHVDMELLPVVQSRFKVENNA